MRAPVKLRSLTAGEVTEIKRLASSRKELMRLVQQAWIIVYIPEDSRLYASEAGQKAGYASVVTRSERVYHFNQLGVHADGIRPTPVRWRYVRTFSKIVAKYLDLTVCLFHVGE